MRAGDHQHQDSEGQFRHYNTSQRSSTAEMVEKMAYATRAIPPVTVRIVHDGLNMRSKSSRVSGTMLKGAEEMWKTTYPRELRFQEEESHSVRSFYLEVITSLCLPSQQAERSQGRRTSGRRQLGYRLAAQSQKRAQQRVHRSSVSQKAHWKRWIRGHCCELEEVGVSYVWQSRYM